MRGLRLHHRIVIPFVIVAIVATSVAAIVTLSVASEALRARLQAQLVSAAGVVSRGDLALNPAILRNVREIIGADVITFGAGGDVIATTVEQDRQDLVMAVRRVVTSASRQDDAPIAVWTNCGDPCLVVHRPVQARPEYVIALIAETSDVRTATRTVARAILLAAALGIVAMFLVSQAVVKRVTAPLDRLVQFAREVTPEGSRRRAQVGDDEVGTLADAFNGMLDRLERSQDALVQSEKLALAGQFAARVAHDIRNPLSSIKMQTQLVRDRLRGSVDEATLMSVLNDIEQVESVIRDLLELARPGQLRFEPTSLNEVASDALHQLAAQFAHRKISVHVDLEEELPLVPLDRTRFKQALLNVLVNASEAMPTGGVVTVRSRRDGDAAVNLQICDSGVGVDPAVLARVFDPFVSTKPDGVGLGLVNVKAVVEGHGGRIRLEPRQPSGTCASITLPVSAGTSHPTVRHPERADG